MERIKHNVARLTLHEVHEALCDMRTSFVNDPEPERGVVTQIEPTTEGGHDLADIQLITDKFNKLLEHIGEVDCLFHDLFDCQ